MKQPFFFSFAQMPLKDHYKTLEIPALASSAEIKIAYRKLARHYHPDKNDNDERATRLFQEIQAAYEVLSNTERRRTYDNELKHAGQYNGFHKDQIINSEQIVKQTKDLLHYINTVTYRSINYDALTDFVLGILNKENMALLLRANNEFNNEQITGNILLASKGILATRSFSEIADQLLLLHPKESSDFNRRIKDELSFRQIKEKQNKLVPYASLGIILLIIIVMCLILFLH